MIAVVGGCAVALALLAYAWWSSASIRGAERSLADGRVREQKAVDDLATVTADREAQKKRADYQEKRANALDAELDAVADSGDPATARERVLSRLAAAEAAAGGASAAAVPAGAAQPHAAVARDNDAALERPGD